MEAGTGRRIGNPAEAGLRVSQGIGCRCQRGPAAGDCPVCSQQPVYRCQE